MKSRSLRRSRPGARHIESLEARVVFDTAAAAEYAPLDTFESDDALSEFLLAQYRDAYEQTVNRQCLLIVEDRFVDFSAATLTSASADHSSTNVQVAGVDEGDLVETDGQFIYSLSGQSLVIIETLPVEDLRVVSRTEFGGEALAMFLQGDRLTVIAAAELDGQDGFSVSILDVSDRSAPALLSTTAIEGNFNSARVINGQVYLLSTQSFQMPGFNLSSSNTASQLLLFNPCHREYESWEEYVDRVAGAYVQDVLPDYQTIDASGNLVAEGKLVSSVNVHAGQAQTSSSLTTLTVLDVNGSEPPTPQASSVWGATNSPAMYANAEQIVLALEHYVTDDFNSNNFIFLVNGNLETSLYSIDISSESAPEWSAAGTVAGTVLDQFSIDIHDDHLRVATTRNVNGGFSLVGGGVTSLYVLAQQDHDLAVVGSVEDFAPGETIFSVRFMGDHAFAVTATVLMDPLFSFDLSDPANPVVLDHLEMPGMSSYLHPAGGDYLIGVGTDNLRFNTGENPRLSLFHVGAGGELTVAEHEVFTKQALASLYAQVGIAFPTIARNFSFEDPNQGNRFEHLAFNYDPATGILSLPLHYRSGQWRETRSDLLVFHIDSQQGTIDPLGVIRHEASIERSVTIEGNIYSISDETMKVHDPAALDEAIASLNFREDPIDVNHDGVVAISDMLSVVAELRMMHREGERLNALRSALQRPDLDVDGDGTVTVNDALFIATNLRTRFVTGVSNLNPIVLPGDSRNIIRFQTITLPTIEATTPWLITRVVDNDAAVLALLAENG